MAKARGFWGQAMKTKTNFRITSSNPREDAPSLKILNHIFLKLKTVFYHREFSFNITFYDIPKYIQYRQVLFRRYRVDSRRGAWPYIPMDKSGGFTATFGKSSLNKSKIALE